MNHKQDKTTFKHIIKLLKNNKEKTLDSDDTYIGK